MKSRSASRSEGPDGPEGPVGPEGPGGAHPTLIAPPPPPPPPPPRITRVGRALRGGLSGLLNAGERLHDLGGWARTGAVLLAAGGQMALLALATRDVPEAAVAYPDPRIPGLWLLLTTLVLLLGHLLLGVTTVVLARAFGGRGGLHRTPSVLAVLAPLSSLPLLAGVLLAPPDSWFVRVLQYGGLLLLAVQLTRHIARTQYLLTGRAFLASLVALLGESQLVHAAATHAGGF